MKNFFAAGLAALAGICIVPAALAAPIVQTDSTYSLFLQGSTTQNASNLTATFDSAPSFFTRDGVNITVTESDTDLGNGVNLISVSLRSDGNLFPAPEDNSDYGLGIADFDGLDLLRMVTLTGATLDLYGENGAFITTITLDVSAGTEFPWSGIYPLFGSVVEIGSAGVPISGFTFNFTVAGDPGTPPPNGVPEPGSLLLFATGIAACAAWRRRQQKAMPGTAGPHGSR